MRTLHGAVSPNGKALDGVAIISEIVSSNDPFTVSQRLSRSIRSFTERPYPHLILAPWAIKDDPNSGANFAIRAAERKHVSPPSLSIVLKYLFHLYLVITHVRRLTPLVHQITNYVAMTQSANVTLALGASPIMATAPEEMEDLSSVIGGLLVNFGTIANIQGMMLAGSFF